MKKRTYGLTLGLLALSLGSCMPSTTSSETNPHSSLDPSSVTSETTSSVTSSTESTPTLFTVVFKNGDTVVSTQQVAAGEMAQIPQDPTNSDPRMVFKGWEGIDETDYLAGEVEVFDDATFNAIWEEMYGTENVYDIVKVRSVYGITVDGELDKTYKDAVKVTASTVTYGVDKGTTADLYTMFDDSYFYLFVDVKDNTPSYRNTKTNGEVKTDRWTEFDDAVEIRMDILHNTSLAKPGWTSGWGGDYRGGNMCEAGFKVAAGCSLGTSYQDGVGAELFWDYWWSNAARTDGKTQMVSKINDAGYTVEIKIACEDNCISGECKPAIGNEIGLGLKIYDKTDNSEEQSIVCLEQINDDMGSSPKRTSNFELIANEHENDPIETKQVIFKDGGEIVATLEGEAGDKFDIPAGPNKEANRLIFDGWDGLTEQEITEGKVVIGEETRIITAKWKQMFGSTTKFESTSVLDGRTITVDGVRDLAYTDTTPAVANKKTAGVDRQTYADVYSMYDANFLYLFFDVHDSTPQYRNTFTGGKSDGRWTESDDSIELRIDLAHDDKYAKEGWSGVWGGDYRGDKMCEAGVKIAAGCSLQSPSKYEDGYGAELYWDFWWASACRNDNKSNMVSKITETGYTVEIALDITKGEIPADCKPADNLEFGLGVKIYDKAEGQDQSIVCLENFNDSMHETPRNTSTFVCKHNPNEHVPEFATVKFVNGDTTVSEGSYEIGDYVTIPETPTNSDERKEFAGWEGISEEEMEAGKVLVEGDKTYTAKWKQMFGTKTTFTGKRASTAITVDGDLDEEYGNTTLAVANKKTAGADRGTYANVYVMYDENFMYLFFDVHDSTAQYRNTFTGGKSDGRWTESDDSIELRIDLAHDDKYAKEGWSGVWGGDYRGDKMCEAGVKIAAGCSLQSPSKYEDGYGAELYWDFWWASACRNDNKSNMVSKITETGYTVEIALDITKGDIPADCKPAEGHKIGLGVKIYDKAEGQDQSIVCLEGINDSMHNTPRDTSTFVLA